MPHQVFIFRLDAADTSLLQDEHLQVSVSSYLRNSPELSLSLPPSTGLTPVNTHFSFTGKSRAELRSEKDSPLNLVVNLFPMSPCSSFTLLCCKVWLKTNLSATRMSSALMLELFLSRCSAFNFLLRNLFPCLNL